MQGSSVFLFAKLFAITNGLERVNEEIRRRERVIHIFHNEDFAIRLIEALLMKMYDSWQTGRAYLNLEEYFADKINPSKSGVQQSVT